MRRTEPNNAQPTPNHLRSVVRELVRSGDYSKAAVLLADVPSPGNGANTSPEFLSAARSLCLACEEYHDEVARLVSALEKAREHESDLRSKLSSVLNMEPAQDPTPSTRNVPVGVRASNGTSAPADAHDGKFWRRWRRRKTPTPYNAATHSEQPTKYHKTIVQHNKGAIRNSGPVPNVEAQGVESASPLIATYCLGQFQVYQNGEPLIDWPNSRSKSIYKYLLSHRDHPVPKEVLMDLFWPDATANAARNCLNVGVYHLRRALMNAGNSSPVLFRDDCYLLNPDFEFWVDADEFRSQLNAGRAKERRGDIAGALQVYDAAEALYQGEFLKEDRYEEWVAPLRQSLQDDYVDVLDRQMHHYFILGNLEGCTVASRKILDIDSCHEDAHRHLMRCYWARGQHHLALRQFHTCLEALAQELELEPSQETVDLYNELRSQSSSA